MAVKIEGDWSTDEVTLQWTINAYDGNVKHTLTKDNLLLQADMIATAEVLVEKGASSDYSKLSVGWVNIL